MQELGGWKLVGRNSTVAGVVRGGPGQRKLEE